MNTLKQIASRAIVFVLALSVLVPAVVMAGDNQMDPKDLTEILNPVVNGHADYSKGNRLFSGEAYEKIPTIRYLGNSILYDSCNCFIL